MRAQLDDVHARGEPLAVLWASEASIYGRFGYGLAALCGDMEIARANAAFVRPVESPGSVTLVDLEDALTLCPRVYDRVCAETPGMFARTREWWESRVLDDPEWRRSGVASSPSQCSKTTAGRRPTRCTGSTSPTRAACPKGDGRRAGGDGGDPGGRSGDLALPPGHRLDGAIEAQLLPLDHPLLPARRRARPDEASGSATASCCGSSTSAPRSPRGRTQGDDSLVLKVADTFCPWNDACFAVRRPKSMEEPDLRLSVDDARLRLPRRLHLLAARAGRRGWRRSSEGALARADALFRTDREPWCPEIF